MTHGARKDGDAQPAPWTQGFTALLRRLAARAPDLPDIGQAQRPQQEAFRLGQAASLSFAPREVASIETRAGKLAIKLFGVGMLGPNGPLPLHMTDQVRERIDTKRDPALADFLDLFHHRAFTHLYRAWSQGQAAAGLDRADQERFTPYVARLLGDEPGLANGTALPTHARWACAPHRVRPARNADGLVSTVSHFFQVPVRLAENCLQWMRLAPDDESRIGWPSASGLIGQGAVAGEAVPDRQSRFRLTLGPLSMDRYLRLTPEGSGHGRDLPALVELVRAFIGFEYAWEVELLVHRQEAPACRMGDDHQLGWSTWMGNPAGGEELPVRGMLFEPEAYLANTTPRAD